LNLEVLGSVALGLGMDRFFLSLVSRLRIVSSRLVSWLLVWKVTVLVFDFSVSGLWLDSFVRAWMDGRVLFGVARMPPVLQLFGLGVYPLRCFDMMSYCDSDCDSGLESSHRS
jgi:hypothetical protein